MKRCKQCRNPIFNKKTFCDEFCKDAFIVSMKNEKFSKERKKLIEKINNKVDKKEIKKIVKEKKKLEKQIKREELKLIKNKPKEPIYYLSENKCVECGGDVWCRYKKVVERKRFCSFECDKKYRYKKRNGLLNISTGNR